MEHTEFLYDWNFLAQLNNIIRSRHLSLDEFELPEITPTQKGVPFLAVAGRNHYIIRYKPVPSFVIYFSPPTETIGANRTIVRDVIYYKLNSKDPNDTKYKSLIPVRGGKHSIEMFMDKFGEWVDGIVQHNIGYEKYKASKLPEPEVIDLNEDKPFSDTEIRILERHKNQTISNLRERIKQLPEADKPAAEQALPEIEKELNEAVQEAKEGEIKKPDWYKKFFNRTVKVIRLLKDIKDSVDFVQWLMVYSFFDIFTIFQTVNFNFHIILDSNLDTSDFLFREFIIQVLLPITKLHTVGTGG